MGNVNVAVLDKISGTGTGNAGEYAYLSANTSSFNDYYPFGMPMPERNGSLEKYRFGFNGQEKDNEIKGDGNQVDFKFRAYDTRLGRFMAVDPLASEYPHYSPYLFAGNRPTQFIDLDGLKEADPQSFNSAINKAEGYRGQPNSSISAFSGISRDQIIDGLKDILNNPSNINADGFMCLPTAMTYLMSRYQPENFVDAVMSIYETGSATIPNGGTIGFTQGALNTLSNVGSFLNNQTTPTITDLFAGALRSSIGGSNLKGDWNQGSRPGMVSKMADELGMKVLHGLTPTAINNAASQRIFSVFLDDWTVYQYANGDKSFDRYGGNQVITLNPETIAGRRFGIHYMVINSKLTYPSSGNMSFTFFSGGKDNYIYDGKIKRFNKGVKGMWIITNK